jgi:L-asparagine transporter-like permease
MFFRRNMKQQGLQLKFKVPASRFISLLGLIAILSITITTWFTNEFKSTLQFGVPLIVVLTFFYYLKRSSAKLSLSAHEESLK